MKRSLFASGVLVAATLATAAGAEPARTARAAAAEPSPFMRIHGTSPPPFGFVQFCERLPAECAPTSAHEARFNASPQRLSELDEVNRHVNGIIAPATDQDLYGVTEHWTLPVDKGDCEDYALLKRQLLLQRGWPSSALLMTVVRDERGDGHAVLTARTAQGDFILDNKVQDIRLWHKTGYRFVMRQSFVDPRMWMSLMPDGAARAGALASTPARR
jgi:predicted transglutaminase-like cysteine proteinase